MDRKHFEYRNILNATTCVTTTDVRRKEIIFYAHKQQAARDCCQYNRSFLNCEPRIDACLINEFGYLGRCHNRTANRVSMSGEQWAPIVQWARRTHCAAHILRVTPFVYVCQCKRWIWLKMHSDFLLAYIHDSASVVAHHRMNARTIRTSVCIIWYVPMVHCIFGIYWKSIGGRAEFCKCFRFAVRRRTPLPWPLWSKSNNLQKREGFESIARIDSLLARSHIWSKPTPKT